MNNIETRTIKPSTSFIENGCVYQALGANEESSLDKKIQLVEDFMKNNSGKGKSEEEKDSLYQKSRELWGDLIDDIKDVKYNYYLNRPQYKFLTDLLLTKMEYDVNTVFFAIELTGMLANMKGMKYTDDISISSIQVNTTEITYVYHLISSHKVKGLGKDAYLFSQILQRIGLISKIFNYYESYSKILADDIKNWVASFEDGIYYDKYDKEGNEIVLESPKL